MAENHSELCLKSISARHRSFFKPLSVSSLKKFKRNRWRILRRKRSKLKYWAHRRQLKIKRKSEELCDTISVFNITDMEMEVAQSQPAYVHPLEEVSAWQNQHQVTYWKSRAIALEYENRMLHKLLQKIHTTQIQEYAECMQEYEQGNEKSHNETDRMDECEQFPGRDSHKTKKQDAHKSSEKQEFCEPPSEQIRKEKQERMNTLYGKMAPRIRGMETAIQLNYDLYVDRHNPPFWPNIPIKL